MKQKIFNLMMMATVVLFLSACSDDDSEGLTRVTYYPTIELEGDDYMVIDKNSTYEEPGYVSLYNGEDVSDQVVVTGNVDTSKSGVYTLNYHTLVNEDGFSASISRTVVVVNPESEIEGFYLVDKDSYREYNGAQVAYGDNFEVLIIDNEDGTYTISDLLGGWYDQRAGYGSECAMEGLVTIGEDGNMEMLDSFVPYWGDSANDFSGSYDAQTHSFTWDCNYTDYPFIFHVILTKE